MLHLVPRDAEIFSILCCFPAGGCVNLRDLQQAASVILEKAAVLDCRRYPPAPARTRAWRNLKIIEFREGGLSDNTKAYPVDRR